MKIYYFIFVAHLVFVQLLYLLGFSFLPMFLVGAFILYVLFLYPIKFGLVEKLILLCIYTLPFSFIAYDGSLYSEKPISYFNLLFISASLLLALRIGCVKKIPINYISNKIYFSVFSLFVGVALSYFASPLTDSWLSSAGTLSIFFLLPLVAINAANLRIPNNNFLSFIDAFQFTIASIAIVVIIQKFFFQFGYSIGVVTTELTYIRIHFVGLLSDRSQASVFLSMVAIMFFVRCLVLKNDWLSKRYSLSLALICLFASGATSARAGLFAFLFSAAALLATQRIPLKRSLLLLLFALPFALLSATYILSQRELAGSIWEDSTRLYLVHDWINIFLAGMPTTIFTGLGLGSQNHAYIGNIFTPHNIILDSIINFGIFGIPILLLPVFIFKQLKDNIVYVSGLLTIYAGAMVSPSMLESRFLAVYLIVGILSYIKFQKK